MLFPITRLQSAGRKQLERRRFPRRAGFTLLEILVVLAIIGLLAGLAITNVDKIFGGAQISTTELQVRESMKTAITGYRLSVGSYPPSLDALIKRPAEKAERWNGPYLEPAVIPHDSWGEPLQYQYPGTRNKEGYDLWSKGPDKQNGTPDDIGNWSAGGSGEK